LKWYAKKNKKFCKKFQIKYWQMNKNVV
jgi:hypothetical protein